MEKRKGIRDLMEKNRYRPRHLQESLTENSIPGSWSGKSGLQNVYNLIDGRVVPRDAYVFVFLSTFLEEELLIILGRYTSFVIGGQDEEDNSMLTAIDDMSEEAEYKRGGKFQWE